MKNVTHLPPIAEDCDGAAGQRLDQKMGYPSLVLRAELARPIDAAHPQHRCPQTV
jgi:hypothetical protein